MLGIIPMMVTIQVVMVKEYLETVGQCQQINMRLFVVAILKEMVLKHRPFMVNSMVIIHQNIVLLK